MEQLNQMPWQPSLGALVQAGGVFFRVWAPARQSVAVAVFQAGQVTHEYPLAREAGGYWSGVVAGARPGTRYLYRLDGQRTRPDPASRGQPAGVHGPSVVVDPAFDWTDVGWHGVARADLVIYEVHVGTATPAGTFEALIERLPGLRALGVTALELLPIADFPGERNWGYDGVALFAPARAYGGGAGLQRLVNAAHAHGLAVLLDVVYNHLGPSGNYLPEFAPDYFSAAHRTPWGPAFNFDGAGADAVRAFFIENALMWVHEFHLDGLRLDATHELIDSRAEHVLAELARRVRASLPAERRFLLFAEDARNEARLARPAVAGGYGLDGIWADDFSHVVRVTLTGEQEGYLGAYQGGASELATVLARGWLYQGQPAPGSDRPRGTPAADLPPASFVYCLQNHDHVGNRAWGDRLHQQISPAAYRAASALLLLAPGVPLMFMGQEWAAGTPFLFFTDHDPELGRRVTAGRRRDYASFAAFQAADIPDPQAPETFARSKLAWDEQTEPEHAQVLQLYRDLLALRRVTPLYRRLRREHITVSVAGSRAVALRLAEPTAGARALVLVVSLGGPAAVNLAAFDSAAGWQLVLDTEASVYGGQAEPLPSSGHLELLGPRAVVYQARP